MMNILKASFLFPVLMLLLVIVVFSFSCFQVFPLGKVLDPFAGAVQNDREGILANDRLMLKGERPGDTVRIILDERKVPHIFANTTRDLFYAQGYMTAALRLWQMDFLAHAAAGRLSEIFDNKDLLDYDRNQRRIGVPDAAKAALDTIMRNTETREALEAYSNGVNAYIHTLGYRTLPLEYKIFDYAPEPWTPLKTVLVLKNMANSMTGFNEDLFLSKLMLTLGEEDFNRLYPDLAGPVTPVMDTLPPGPGAAPHIMRPGFLDYSFLSASGRKPEADGYNPRLGSNSWAVSGRKTKSGFPILANDPHLGLSLPSIWVEMQLSAPGINVYGVSIPGTPAVIIGFNRDIAWGLTNGADDVKDWYKLKMSVDHNRYELDGRWYPLSERVDTIRRKGQQPFYDTVYSTVIGPVVSDEHYPGRHPDLMYCALWWQMHRPSNEFLTFLQLGKAKNYADYKAAIGYFSCPLQNFTFACRDNTIAITHQGSLPVKHPGQGKFILDGSRSENFYSRYIPEDSLPQELNPGRGYVLSANQHPAYNNYPYYIDGAFAEARANRIGGLLAGKDSLDIPDMEAMQLDNISAFAVSALPVLLGKIDRARLDGGQRQLLDSMACWKGDFNGGDKNALLYEWWWETVSDSTWDELERYPFYMRPPDDAVLLDLIQRDPGNRYFDKLSTERTENAEDIVTESFAVAADAYRKRAGTGGDMSWGAHNRVNIMHPANLPAFSIMHLPSAGYPTALNAVSANWGPSWRMVVQLGDRPRAFGIYPGGQTGNEGSPYYDDFVKDWNQGHYYPLHYFLTVEEAEAGRANHEN